MIALCRVVLRKDQSQIILMDEPTSNLDFDTDKKMMEMIKEVLEDKTVFIIAHRLDTLETMDKILVMKDGSMDEFDSPEALLENPKSFYTENLSLILEQHKH